MTTGPVSRHHARGRAKWFASAREQRHSSSRVPKSFSDVPATARLRDNRVGALIVTVANYVVSAGGGDDSGPVGSNAVAQQAGYGTSGFSVVVYGLTRPFRNRSLTGCLHGQSRTGHGTNRVQIWLLATTSLKSARRDNSVRIPHICLSRNQQDPLRSGSGMIYTKSLAVS